MLTAKVYLSLGNFFLLAYGLFPVLQFLNKNTNMPLLAITRSRPKELALDPTWGIHGSHTQTQFKQSKPRRRAESYTVTPSY